MILPFRHAKRQAIIERKQDALAQTVMEVFAHRPIHDLSLAIGAGVRAIERGLNFMDAMDIVEGVLKICDEQLDNDDRVDLMNQRNLDRLAFYTFKHAVIYGE